MSDPPRTSRASRTPHVAFGVFVGVAVLAVTWPGAKLFGTADPRVLGLPFSLAWIVMWVLAMFVALLWYERATGEDGSR